MTDPKRETRAEIDTEARPELRDPADARADAEDRMSVDEFARRAEALAKAPGARGMSRMMVV